MGWPDWVTVYTKDFDRLYETNLRIKLKGVVKISYNKLKIFSAFSPYEEYLLLLFESDYTNDKQILIRSLNSEKEQSILLQGSKI